MQQSETEASLGGRNQFRTLTSSVTVIRFEPGASFGVGMFEVLQNNVDKKV